MKVTLEHLAVSLACIVVSSYIMYMEVVCSLLILPASQDYAREGLRTLVLAKKDIPEEEYREWAEEHYAAR